MLEDAGLAVQLVSASQAKNLKGRPKTDRLDAMWLARLTQHRDAAALVRAARRDPGGAGLHPGPGQDLVAERTRVLQRLEKLLEDAMIKITSVTREGMTAMSSVAMVQALIAGERDPRVLADLAKAGVRGKTDALAEAWTGMFTSHHGAIARVPAGPGRVPR